MLKFRKLDIFITRQFLLLFVGAFVICQFVLMMQMLWKYVDDLIGKGLTLEILAQFFFYMGMVLVPQALPLAILLSSLITFGNLGESFELTAIKAAGVSLMRTFRSLIVISILLSGVSFVFQNVIAPQSQVKLAQLLRSMRQMSPELQIPEGVFYDGVPGTNIYVQKKDVERGILYGVMIYRMSNSYEDSEIILADSGMIQTTAEKKHLLLTLWAGEWFSNQSSEVGSNAEVPYRRETFIEKRTLIDFDSDFNMADATGISSDARAKSLSHIARDMDSLIYTYDSIGRDYYKEAKSLYYRNAENSRDSLIAIKDAAKEVGSYTKIWDKMTSEEKQEVLARANSRARAIQSNFEFRSFVTEDGDRFIREHRVEIVRKFTLALSCIIFFFIGAPLGAIIRKGGLGIPVIISVLVFILYYILEYTSIRMARNGLWTVWFGVSLSTAILTPLAAFVTYKANKDSVVFNSDAYRMFFIKLLGLRIKRHVVRKEVIINEPDYDKEQLEVIEIMQNAALYNQRKKLRKAPDAIEVFFHYTPDHKIEGLSEQLEVMIESLSNTKDNVIIDLLNRYPVLSVSAHTRPFERKWLNVLSAIIVPLGLILYIRMWLFRLRLNKDLVQTIKVSEILLAKLREKNL